MNWTSGVPRFLLSLLGASAVVAVLWAAGFGIYSAFVTWGGWMGSAAIVSVIIFIIATFVFMEE